MITQSDFIQHVTKRELYGNTLAGFAVSDFQLYKNQILNSIKNYKVIDSKQKYKTLSDEVKELIKNYQERLKQFLISTSETLVTTECKWLSKAFEKDISENSVYSLLKMMPVAEFSSFQDLSNKLCQNLLSCLELYLRTSLVTKIYIANNINSFEKKLSKWEDKLHSVIKVFNTTCFDCTDRVFFEKNEMTVMFYAILEKSTCTKCGLYSGQIFKIKNAPLLPLHYGCKCFYIPESLVTEKLTYIKWINTLDDSDKKSVLGKERFELFKKGYVVSKFFSNYEKIPLSEIEK